MKVPKAPERLSLLDLKRKSEIVKIEDGVEIEMFGLRLEDVAMLMVRFPDLHRLLVGMRLDPEEIIKIAPGSVAAIIAAGNKHPGEEDAENAASDLTIEVQWLCLSAIGRATFAARGFGPFVREIMAAGLVPAPISKAPVMSSPNSSSPPAEDDSPRTETGNEPQDNSQPSLSLDNEIASAA